MRKFAEHGGQSRIIAVVALRLFLPIINLVIALGSLVWMPISVLAYGQATQPNYLSMAAAGAAAGIQNKPSVALISRLTRDQGPEQEQALNFAINSVVSTPTAIRTDRKIKTVLLQVRMRITNAGTGPTLRTGPALLGSANSNILFGLIQQVTIRGQHARFGAQTIFQMRGEAAAEYYAILYPNWNPYITVSANGAAAARGGALSVTAAQTNDVEFVLPIPLYPPGINASDVPFYALHGPDWAGNLYVDVQFADGTALATANPPTTFTAYGSASGVGLCNVLTERPLLGKDLMANIKPAVTFRVTNAGQPTNAVIGASGSGLKLLDMITGKDTTRLFLKTGTQSAAQTAGVISFGSLSDGIVTRTFFALDARQLRFQPSNGDANLQDYMGRLYGRVVPIGYKLIDFISTPGDSDANPKAAFPSSKLTAARKFELDGDIVAAANQLAEITQEMTLGSPAYLG